MEAMAEKNYVMERCSFSGTIRFAIINAAPK